MNQVTVYTQPKPYEKLGKYFASYFVPEELMVAITSKKKHRASDAERLHLMLIGIPIPCGMPVEIYPPGCEMYDTKLNDDILAVVRQIKKGTYYVRINPSPIRLLPE